MKNYLPLLLLLLGLVGFVGCKKTEVVPIDGNVAPPDETIPTIVQENYVNRVYISLLGRKPDDTEFQTGLDLLGQNNMAVADRETLLDQVMAKPDFSQHLFDQNRAALIPGADTSSIQGDIYIYGLLLQDPQYQAIYPTIQDWIDKLTLILEIPEDLEQGNILLPEAHRRLVANPIYDDLNMGSLNFVRSCFESLLLRYPTTDELESGIRMVDGFSGIMFTQSGRNKDDFLDIFFASNDYYEGQVRDVYQKFLFRDPTSVEMAEVTEAYFNSGDYPALIKTVMSSDEYVGIE